MKMKIDFIRNRVKSKDRTKISNLFQTMRKIFKDHLKTNKKILNKLYFLEKENIIIA